MTTELELRQQLAGAYRLAALVSAGKTRSIPTSPFACPATASRDF